jgi:peptidoglycan hydrolase-like protein with peptidoglycan-binding domain
MAVSDEQKIANIKEAQNYLRTVSKHNPKVSSVLPSGIYDDDTKEAVKSFQSEYGLPVTGKIDTETWDSLYKVYKEAIVCFSELVRILPVSVRNDPVISGNAGYSIYIIQAMLNTISQFYDNMKKAPINGIYDSETAESVKSIQRVNGQEQTGEIDINTWNSLAMLYNYHSSIDERDYVPLKIDKDAAVPQNINRSVG